MLDAKQIADASAALRDQWRHGTKLTDLPSSIRPRDRAQGYAVHAELEKLLAQRTAAECALKVLVRAASASPQWASFGFSLGWSSVPQGLRLRSG